MAIYRTIQMSFWTDSKIADTFSPDEKLMYLYLLTNPHTNLCGCYEISFRQIAFEIGFKKDQVDKLIKALQEKRIVVYEVETGEVLIVNWHRYNWTLSPKFRKPLINEIKAIKHEPFRQYLENLLKKYSDDTVSIPYPYPMDTTVLFCSDPVTDTVTDTVTVNVPNANRKSIAEDFEELWKAYPRKQGKRNAFEAYKRARKDGITDKEIMAGIEAYSEYVRVSGTEPQFIKMGGTFFNQRAWNDDWTPRRKKDRLEQQFEDVDRWAQNGKQNYTG